MYQPGHPQGQYASTRRYSLIRVDFLPLVVEATQIPDYSNNEGGYIDQQKGRRDQQGMGDGKGHDRPEPQNRQKNGIDGCLHQKGQDAFDPLFPRLAIELLESLLDLPHALWPLTGIWF